MRRTLRRAGLAAALILGLLAPVSDLGLAAEPHHPAATTEERPNIRIDSDADFTRANGVRAGRGTAASPYVISGWHLGQILVSDTSKHLVIRDNVIDGSLILDWNGSHVHVHGNRIGDLHVNRNVPRTGTATSGVFAHNTIGRVGQLRHFDGDFEHNVVGNPTPDALGRYAAQAVQFDGFNGSRFRFNTIYGYVEARLHGHHHGSGFGMPSHEHASHGMAANHARRYHQVWITGNTIHADHTYALRYYDTGHAGNDRTNNSETNKALRKPHIHFTRVHLSGNRLVGSGLAVHVFNAPDDKHTGTTRGLVEIRNNRIALRDDRLQMAAGARDGIALRTLHDVNLRIAGNVINGPAGGQARPLDALSSLHQPAGIRIEGVNEGRIWITDNTVTARRFGVYAVRFDQQVVWSVRRLVTDGVPEPVHYDGTVRNDPAP